MNEILFVFLSVFSTSANTKVFNLKNSLPKIAEKENFSFSIETNGEIKIVNKGKQITVPLLKIQNPQLNSDSYSLWGKIRYTGVEKNSYLELWNVFGKRKFFTLTKDGSGFMKNISGNSEYRNFSLPFNQANSMLKLKMLQLNLVIMGEGEIIFSPQVYLVDGTKNPYKEIKKRSVKNLPWWDDDTGGYIGGLLGLLIGLCGAVSAYFIHKGKQYRLVKICIGVILVIALASLIAGISAYFCNQPYVVYYPMLLSGFISVFVFGFQALVAKKQFESTTKEE
ncbi:MAG: hypothetical protein PF689_09435 [Deltaproteobacteria bacterium]|nr:hypothetical protein [Deltaproteobacteria bacterium]